MAIVKNTVKLKKYLDIIEEYVATAVQINPGALLEVTATGLVQAHSTAGGASARMFALEDEMQGAEINDLFAVSARVQVWCAVPGEIVYANIAAGAVVAEGAALASNGDGTLAVAGVGDVVIGYATEAIDMTIPAEAAIGRTPIRVV